MGEKKVLTILLGSPRVNGNTEKLADALAKGAEKNGWEIRKVRLAAMNIRGCMDCRRCWSAGRPCVQDDDMDKVYQDIDAAAAIAFVSPVYFYSWSTQIKPAWDRLLPYGAPGARHSLKDKKAILLTAAADDSDDIFNGVTESFRHSSAFIGWEAAGEILARGVFDKGEIDTKGAAWLKMAEELGSGL